VLRSFLRADDRTDTHGGATGSMELHLPFTPVPNIRLSVDVRFVDTPQWPFDPGQTGKLPGVHVWDGEWAHWAGGSKEDSRYWGPDTCSFRFVHNNWNRDQPNATVRPNGRGEWWLGAYLYLGGDDVDSVETAYGSPLNYGSNGRHTGEWLFKQHRDRQPLNEWIHLEAHLWGNNAGSANGGAHIEVDGAVVLELTGVAWTEDQTYWNHGYPQAIFGGPPSFAPPQRPSGVDRGHPQLHHRTTMTTTHKIIDSPWPERQDYNCRMCGPHPNRRTGTRSLVSHPMRWWCSSRTTRFVTAIPARTGGRVCCIGHRPTSGCWGRG